MVCDCPASGFDEVSPELSADFEVFHRGSFTVVERVGEDGCILGGLGYCVSCALLRVGG